MKARGNGRSATLQNIAALRPRGVNDPGSRRAWKVTELSGELSHQMPGHVNDVCAFLPDRTLSVESSGRTLILQDNGLIIPVSQEAHEYLRRHSQCMTMGLSLKSLRRR